MVAQSFLFLRSSTIALLLTKTYIATSEVEVFMIIKKIITFYYNGGHFGGHFDLYKKSALKNKSYNPFIGKYMKIFYFGGHFGAILNISKPSRIQELHHPDLDSAPSK